jgi:hypothetical protein
MHEYPSEQELLNVLVETDSSWVVLGAEKHLDGQRIYDNPEIDIYLTSGDRISHSRFDQDYSYSGKLLSSLSGEQLGFILQNRFGVLQREQ